MIRAWFNRWRRAAAQALLYRMVHGERSASDARLAHTRIAPSTCIVAPEHLQLGDHVFIGQFNHIDASGGVTIDEGVQIASFVAIASHSSHRALRVLGRAYANWDVAAQGLPPGYVRAPVHIGAYSFIGPHSLIEPGARIGRGVVVCAYSQVRGEVPDFAIVAGQPARVVGDVRDADAQLRALHPGLPANATLDAARGGPMNTPQSTPQNTPPGTAPDAAPNASPNAQSGTPPEPPA